jgi:thiol-disulfide isomerase/thioredoxin
MTNYDEKNCKVSVCASGGPGKWIWIVLAVAVVGVVIAKNMGKKDVTASGTPAAAVAPATATTAPELAAQGNALPHLVDLGATKCIPCKMMAPILEDLKQTYTGKLDVVFIDVWQTPDAGKKYGINLIPTQIFYDSQGKELFRHEGFFAKADILAKWKEFGVDLPIEGNGEGTGKNGMVE